MDVRLCGIAPHGGRLGLTHDGRIAAIGTTTQTPASIDSGGATAVLAELEPGDDATDDEILLAWFTADGVPDGYAWIMACDGL